MRNIVGRFCTQIERSVFLCVCLQCVDFEIAIVERAFESEALRSIHLSLLL